MTKIVINCDFGGFSLTKEIIQLGQNISGDVTWPHTRFYDHVERTDPILVRAVEAATDKGKGDLEITEVPEGTKYIIYEYDGAEEIWTKEGMDWLTA